MINSICSFGSIADVYSITMRDGSHVQDMCRIYISQGNGDYLPSFIRTRTSQIKTFKKIGRITNIKIKSQ